MMMMKNAILFTTALLLSVSPVLAAGDANPFAGAIYQAVAAVTVFLVVFLVLKFKAWGPILKGLQDRENRIKDDLDQAERAAKDAATTLSQYKKQLADAGAESAKILEQSKADAQRLAAQIKEQTQTEITAMKKRAQSDIDAARQQAMTDIYTQTAALATDVAGRILQREINAKDQQALVEQSLAEFAKLHRN